MKKVIALVMAAVMVLGMFAGFVMNEEYPLAFMVVVENGGYGRAACVPVIAPVLAACKAVLDGE